MRMLLLMLLAGVVYGAVANDAARALRAAWERSYLMRRRRAAQLRVECAQSSDCRIAIFIHGCDPHDVATVACTTHGMVRLEFRREVVAVYASMVRAREGGAR